jgi:pyridoxine 5-phosphate synthase
MNIPAIPRLGVNLDHVATIRNARGGTHPDPVRAAIIAAEAGADGITAHLREDRRHIGDDDLPRLMMATNLPLNLEMAATEEMTAIACRLKPHAVCLVPERRAERTTEGGLDVLAGADRLPAIVSALKGAGIRVSLFIAPDPDQVAAARAVGAQVIELHTGSYADVPHAQAAAVELQRLKIAAKLGSGLGLEIHAGHGLRFDNVVPVAAIAEVAELNIGHFLVGEAIFIGLAAAIGEMRALMRSARSGALSQ